MRSPPAVSRSWSMKTGGGSGPFGPSRMRWTPDRSVGPGGPAFSIAAVSRSLPINRSSKELEHFILTDMGTHILDTARFLFGEARSLYARTHKVNREIKGEDAATLLMDMESGLTLAVEISYASILENEAFPQAYVEIEGESGSLLLTRDYWIKSTDRSGTTGAQFPPVSYAWADPQYDLVHSSIVACNRNLLAGLNGEAEAETTAADNLKTLQLVYDAYESAENGRIIRYA